MTSALTTQRLSSLPLQDFLAAVAAPTPAPGGGSVAALTGALGGALVVMVARLTLGRERYAAAQDEMAWIEEEGIALQRRLTDLVEADAAAYQIVADAYALPKDQIEEKAHRATAIEDALRGAVEVPLSVASACVDVLGLAARAAGRGNPSAATDAVVAALLADAGLQGAARNVRTNLRAMHDEGFCDTAERRIAELLALGEEPLRQALAMGKGA